jgi:hypothetical protein
MTPFKRDAVPVRMRSLGSQVGWIKKSGTALPDQLVVAVRSRMSERGNLSHFELEGAVTKS